MVEIESEKQSIYGHDANLRMRPLNYASERDKERTIYMKAVGAVALLIAAILVWFAFVNYSDAAVLRNSIENQGEVVEFIGEVSGSNEVDRVRADDLVYTGHKYVGGAVILAIVGIWMLSNSE
jgi:hypothetical protein